MAGRILPIALATVAGVSIGMATFDSEFKEMRKKRLEREYQESLAAKASSEKDGFSASESKAVETQTASATDKEVPPTKLSSLFSLGAWKTGGKPSPSVSKDSHSPETK